jgi:transposase-like protein
MDITAPQFTDENAAREHLESLRWPDGPFCPHCGSVTVTRLEGKKHRAGLIQCNDCREQFTVTVGTVFERSKVPLHKWVLATHLLTASKKGMSAHQIGRMLGVTYKTAWFMCHRIREAMREPGETPMGGGGGIVEADETFIGREPGATKKRGYAHKMKVLALVDRDTRKARTMVVDSLKVSELAPILQANIAREARLMTDEASHYRNIGTSFARHDVVRHGAGEYVRGKVHTNTAESYFSIFKRGMKGIYQHCGKQHLHRYAAEFEFRYNNRIAHGIHDAERTEIALRGIEGKRLTYRRINGQEAHA